jgi:multiple sugar transport system substrate-binding protein
MITKPRSILKPCAVALLAALGVLPTWGQEKITLGWAAWDPANALVELSKDFTKETGIQVDFDFVPWTSYADRMLNELNTHSSRLDLLIGDSQWLGGSAENGHYIKLNDFLDKEHISMDDFVGATVEGYATWPKHTKNYWAVPAMGDAVGWTYRKDWFARPDIRAAFKAQYNRELGPPETWTELYEVAKFFQGREIDGKKVYGAAIFTERGSEGITMGLTCALYSWGVRYDDPNRPYHLEGFTNSPDAVEAVEFYKKLYKECTPPGYTNAYMQEGLDAFKSGQVAMMMNWFAFFPGLSKDPVVGGKKIGFFINPEQKARATALGGQGISVVSYSQHKEAALKYIKWFVRPEVQQKWWELGGYSCRKSVLLDPKFKTSAPFAREFITAMGQVQDFWQEPAYAELLLSMQRRLHDYVVADQGTAKEALDKIVGDWLKVFREEGKY